MSKNTQCLWLWLDLLKPSAIANNHFGLANSFNDLLYLTESASIPSVSQPKAQASGDTIVVTWVKPEADVTGYFITCTLKGAGADDAPHNITLDTGEVSEAQFVKLEEGKEYEVQIVAMYGERKSEAVSIQTSEFCRKLHP